MSKTELTFKGLYEPQLIEGDLQEVMMKFNAAVAQHHNFIMVNDADQGTPVVVSIAEVVKMKEIDD